MRSTNRKNEVAFDRNPAILSMRTKRELVKFVTLLFEQEGSAAALGVDRTKLNKFITVVSRHYKENPYHNFHHAVDTVNTVGWFITRPILAEKLPVETRFLLLLTALIHDVEHPGHNNQFEIRIESSLARKYHNDAVLENHSLDVMLNLMKDPAHDIFSSFGKGKVKAFNAAIEEMVLATDFAVHRKFLDEFKVYMDTHTIDFSDQEFLMWLSKALMKAADIANTSKPFPEAKVWGKRVMMEFWAQGMMEKEKNLPIGPLNDSETVKLNSAQAGFIKFAALELFVLLNRVDPAIGEMVANLEDNLQTYEELAERGEGLFE